MQPPEHVVVLERLHQFFRRCVSEREWFGKLCLFVNDAINPPMLLIAQLRLIGAALASLPTLRRWVVLHDVVVPVDHPHLAVGADLRHDGRCPFIVAGEQVPGIARAEAGAVRLDDEGREEMTGRLGHEGGAGPGFAWITAGGIEGVPCSGGELAAPVYLAGPARDPPARGPARPAAPHAR